MSHSSQASSRSRHSLTSHNKESIDRKRKMFGMLGYSPKPIGSLLNRPKHRQSSKFSIEEKHKSEEYFKNKTDVINPKYSGVENIDNITENIPEFRRNTSNFFLF